MKDLPMPFKVTGSIVALIGALLAMGVIILPWDAATKQEVTALDKQNQVEHSDIGKSMVRVETKLDIVIQLLEEKKK